MQEVTSSILVSSILLRSNTFVFERSRNKPSSEAEPKWRNGRRGGLKNRCPQRHVGSTPSFGIMFSKIIMMKKFLFRIFVIVAAVNLALCAHAQSTKIITLKDGSVIKGNVLQLADGVYTLETDNLGKVNVAESEILSIAAEPAPVPPDTADTANTSLKGQVQEMQTSLLSNPEVMTEIQNIMQDPEIRGVLSDPAFISAIMSYDPKQIQHNEKTQYLLQNPKFRSLMEKVQKKLPASK